MALSDTQISYLAYCYATVQTNRNYQYLRRGNLNVELGAFRLSETALLRYFFYGLENNTAAWRWLKENQTPYWNTLAESVEVAYNDPEGYHMISPAVGDGTWNQLVGYLARENNESACERYADKYLAPVADAVLSGRSFGTREEVLIGLLAIGFGVPYTNMTVMSAGDGATLDKLYTTALNIIPTTYWSSCKTYYEMCQQFDPSTWTGGDYFDDASAQNPNDNEGGVVTERNGEVSHIMQYGNDLYLYGSGEFEKGIVFHKSIGQMWTCGNNTNGTPVIGGNTGGGSHPSGDFDAMWALIDPLLETWRYIYGGDRYDPVSAGGTDCSGFVHWAFWKTFGVEVGYSTEDIWEVALRGNVTYVIGKYSSWNELPWDSMEAGDIVEMSRDNPASNRNPFSAGTRSHVAIYSGTGRMAYDVGSTPCPKYRSLDVQTVRSVGVCRLK